MKQIKFYIISIFILVFIGCGDSINMNGEDSVETNPLTSLLNQNNKKEGQNDENNNE